MHEGASGVVRICKEEEMLGCMEGLRFLELILLEVLRTMLIWCE